MEKKRYKACKWEDMGYDILLKIFMTLDIMDLMSNISRVCNYWRLVCRDPILWGTLDFSLLKSNYITIPWQLYSRDDEPSKRLMEILKIAFDLSRGHVTCLIFHFDMYIKDEHLIYTAERCPNLKRLILSAWSQITVDGYSKAFKMWEGLESMTIPGIIGHPSDIMEAIGKHCKNFSELKIMCPLDLDFAIAITTFLPKLRVLSLRCSILTKVALVHIINSLENLEVLNLSHCFIEYVHSLEVVSVLEGLDTSVIEKASRIRKFIYCQDRSCAMCQNRTDNEESLTWPVYDKEFLRMDEVSSLAH